MIPDKKINIILYGTFCVYGSLIRNFQKYNNIGNIYIVTNKQNSFLKNVTYIGDTSVIKFGEHIRIYGVKHICGGVRRAYRHDHWVSHCFFIKILEAVLSQQNPVFPLREANRNSTIVTFAYRELLRAVGRLVNMDFTEHTGRAGERVVDSAELLYVEMRIKLILDLV